MVDRLERLELVRLSRPADADLWKTAWEAHSLAAETAKEGLRAPTAADLGTVWACLKVARACECWLGESGETSADDNGDTAARRIEGLLDRLTGRALRAVDA